MLGLLGLRRGGVPGRIVVIGVAWTVAGLAIGSTVAAGLGVLVLVCGGAAALMLRHQRSLR